VDEDLFESLWRGYAVCDVGKLSPSGLRLREFLRGVVGIDNLEAEVAKWQGIPEIDVRPTIVCLCGSTRFGDAFAEAGWRETLAGKIVLSIGVVKTSAADAAGGHAGEALGQDVADALDELHRRKIDLADEVLFLNVGDYVGESTFGELIYARKQGKRIRWLEDSAYTEEGETVEETT
jgi:hypothetical protein